MFVPHILVPIGGETGSARALETADQLAPRLGADIEILSVVGDPQDVASRREAMEALTTGLLSNVPVSVTVSISDDTRGTIEAAAENATVCMATSTRLMRHEGHFGSTAEHLLRTASDPVILLGPEASAAFSATTRVIVPVDGSAASERAVVVGGDLAHRINATLWVTTVVTPDQLAAATKIGVSQESGYVRRLAQGVSGAQFEVLHDDDPAAAILDFSGADGVVVLTTHGRSGLRRLVAGSVAMAVVADAKAPVVVVPPGFQPAG